MDLTITSTADDEPVLPNGIDHYQYRNGTVMVFPTGTDHYQYCSDELVFPNGLDYYQYRNDELVFPNGFDHYQYRNEELVSITSTAVDELVFPNGTDHYQSWRQRLTLVSQIIRIPNCSNCLDLPDFRLCIIYLHE